MSGLVYLRSRWYQPDHGSFITMDSSRKENRYAFCSGDPINLFDGTGHSPTGAMIAGLVVGIAATVIAGVLTGDGINRIGPELSAAGRLGDRLANLLTHDDLVRPDRRLDLERRHVKLDEVLQSDDYDAVHLVTPIPLHAEQTAAVLNSGKHHETERRHWDIEVHATSAELEAFAEGGYLVREGLFEGEALQQLQDALDQLEERERGKRARAASGKRSWGFIPRYLMDKDEVAL